MKVKDSQWGQVRPLSARLRRLEREEQTGSSRTRHSPLLRWIRTKVSGGEKADKAKLTASETSTTHEKIAHRSLEALCGRNLHKNYDNWASRSCSCPTANRWENDRWSNKSRIRHFRDVHFMMWSFLSAARCLEAELPQDHIFIDLLLHTSYLCDRFGKVKTQKSKKPSRVIGDISNWYFTWLLRESKVYGIQRCE